MAYVIKAYSDFELRTNFRVSEYFLKYSLVLKLSLDQIRTHYPHYILYELVKQVLSEFLSPKLFLFSLFLLPGLAKHYEVLTPASLTCLDHFHHSSLLD